MDMLNEPNESCYIKYLDKMIPYEFKDVCKEQEFVTKISKRSENPFRFYVSFEKYLKKRGMENTSYYASKYGYDKSICRLLDPNMTERGFKSYDLMTYNSFFKDRSDKEQKKMFESADYGARTVFQLEQDTIASNVFEDMLCRNSGGFLIPNRDATGRGDESGISTKADLEFIIPPGIYKTKLDVPSIKLEVKGQFRKFDGEVNMRGSADQIIKDEGLILIIYLNDDKFAVVDPTDPKHNISGGDIKKGGKKYENISISRDELQDFPKLDDEKSMKPVLRCIYDTYKKRKERGQ